MENNGIPYCSHYYSIPASSKFQELIADIRSKIQDVQDEVLISATVTYEA